MEKRPRTIIKAKQKTRFLSERPNAWNITEIAAYGTVRAMAEKLGDRQAATLLSQTLQEEKDTDERLTQLADKMKVVGGSDPKGQTARA